MPDLFVFCLLLSAPLPSAAPPDMTARLVQLIHKYWNRFYSAGVSRPILGLQFSVATGSAQPSCCRQPRYGIFESRIMDEHIRALLSKQWIQQWNRGAWGSMIVLAPKPHQEKVNDINSFVWRFCVSYRRLNSLTLPFRMPIPTCAEAIENLGPHHGRLFFITLDAGSGFHQIAVADDTMDKLAFFGPGHMKYTWRVMPFGPINARQRRLHHLLCPLVCSSYTHLHPHLCLVVTATVATYFDLHHDNNTSALLPVRAAFIISSVRSSVHHLPIFAFISVWF